MIAGVEGEKLLGEGPREEGTLALACIHNVLVADIGKGELPRVEERGR